MLTKSGQRLIPFIGKSHKQAYKVFSRAHLKDRFSEVIITASKNFQFRHVSIVLRHKKSEPNLLNHTLGGGAL